MCDTGEHHLTAGYGFLVEALEIEHALLADRIAEFGDCRDSEEIWRILGWDDPEQVPMLSIAEFIAGARTACAS